MRLRLTFGLFGLEPKRNLGESLTTFCGWLGEALDAEIDRDETPDYETLAERVRAGKIDIAWLPPIVLLRVGESAAPIVSIRRGERGGFETALVVRADAPQRTLHDLRGLRAAWVDAWSAAGYVIPRLRLRLSGLDLANLFREERFHGTHTAALRALLANEADVAGTYARTDADGNVVDGPWMEIPDAKVRVIATFGEIPADVFAMHATAAPATRERLAAALSAMANDPVRRPVMKQLFGADGFGAVDLEAYEGLQAALALATRTGDWEDMSSA